MSPRKRPPPITIPSAPRLSFSGNAFAIAKARDDDALDRHRERSNAFYALEKKSMMVTPAGTPLTISDSQRPLGVLEPSVNKTKEQEFTPMTITTTMTQFIDSGHETLQGIPVSKTSMSDDRSLADGRPGQGQIARQSVDTKGSEGTEATIRATIEARHEKKLFKIMGIVPTTPTSSDSERDAIGSTKLMISKMDLSNECAKAAIKQQVEQNEPKSPKKKLFGMSIPNFRTATTSSNDDPPMPPKAAQLLGSSPSKKRRNLRPIKGQRSETSTSLPPKLDSTNRSNDKPAKPSYHSKSYYGSRTKNSRQLSTNTPTPRQRDHLIDGVKILPLSHEQLDPHGFSNKALPPTPKTKVTPPNAKAQHAQALIDGLGISTTCESGNKHECALSDMTNLGLSPTKFCPYGAQEYTGLVKTAPSISSMYGAIENNGTYSAPLESVRRGQVDNPFAGRWSEGQAEERRQQIGMLNGGQLPPTFYTPSEYSVPFGSPGCRPSHNFDTQRFLFSARNNISNPTHAHASHASGESIEICFQDNVQRTVSEAERRILPAFRDNFNYATNHVHSSAQIPGKSSPASIVYANMRTPSEDACDNFVNQKEASDFTFNSTLAGESLNGQQKIFTGKDSNSTSYGLTPLLNEQLGGSPPKGRCEFVPRHPSALPSPLYGHTTMPLGPPNHLLADGSDIITHFGVANHHIDLVAQSLHKSIDMTKQEAINSMVTKYNETVIILEQHVSDIKAHLNAVEHNMGRMSGEAETLNSKLDKLVDFLKEEVVEPLIKNIQRNVNTENELKAYQASTENELKALQAVVQELQKNSGTPQSQSQHPRNPGSSSDNASLPAHHSQYPRDSGLAYYDEPNADLIRELPVRMHVVRQMRNDGRFQQYCHDVGQTWASTDMGREQEESIRRQYLTQFAGNGPGHFGGGYGGAYAGAYPTDSPSQGYGSGMNAK
ncbi:hypothetical protein AOQ84DRAFT_366849 [Glonium stellatum]|uniref:Uncharacterized protein n=1 Tax=Glonium stellatum TaxID=574774 RepID=A0A8E2EV87_9PEZI|nr:hypothetical protein AOQ84DRAFT_366849 [Glonium stellatum]